MYGTISPGHMSVHWEAIELNSAAERHNPDSHRNRNTDIFIKRSEISNWYAFILSQIIVANTIDVNLRETRGWKV